MNISRLTSVLLALTLIIPLQFTANSAAQAASCPGTLQDGELQRLSGADRIETAVAISQDSFANNAADAVVLAVANDYADALVGAPFAKLVNAPLLLTSGSALNSVTLAEAVRVLKPGGTVYLLGGTNALSSQIEPSLTQLGINNQRIAGPDRYATAVRVAERFPSAGLIQIGIATGENFADALSLGAPAARDLFPILLTRTIGLDAHAGGFISSATGLQSVYIAGGVAAVSDNVATDVAVRTPDNTSLNRFGGADRYSTSVAIVSAFFGSQICNVALASGENFPDGLAGSVHAGANNAALLLTRRASVPTPLQTLLEDHESTISGGYLYGGPNAITELTLTSAELMFDPASLLFWGDSGESNPHWDNLAGIISAQVAAGGIDGALMLGDNIYNSGASSAADPAFATLYETPLASVLGSLQIDVALGNHDIITNNGQGELDYATTHDYWYMPNRYYARTIDGVRLVGLDTNPTEMNDTQVAFLDDQLAADPDSVHRIAFGHHPIFSSGIHGDSDWLQNNVRPTLEKQNTDFYFSGHDHNFEAITPQNGVNYIVSGAASRLRPSTNTDKTIFAASTYHVGRIDIFYSYADVTIFDETGAQIWTNRYPLN